MNIKKLLSIITLASFTFSSVGGEALHAALDMQAGTGRPVPTLEDRIIPRTFGQITDSKIVGSKQIVVNIQDLHCHPEVQRTISKILSTLDEKYGIKNVYVEGGYGDISTSWLCNIKDKEVRKEIIETLVDQGRLTGAEYYSALSNRPDLLKGIENEAIHKANIVRLGKILKRKPYFEQKLKVFDKDFEFIKNKYFGPKNRRFNDLIDKRKAGKISTDKYYALLNKYVNEIHNNPERYNAIFTVSMENYPNISTYLELAHLQKQLHYKRISRQLQELIQSLKSRLPYRVYASLIAKTDNFSKMDELYLDLAEIAKENNFDLKHNFPDLASYFEYREKSRKLNPVHLIQEEKRLVEEIRIGFSQDVNELEVSFLADFYGYFKDYLSNALTADDYTYFAQRFGKFKSVWNKYSYDGGMHELESDFGVLSEFYESNCRRNTCFIENIPLVSNMAAAPPASCEQQSMVESAKNSELIVVITGGFHTEGLKELLRDKKISYLCITPNMTQDTATSSAIYTELANQQAKMFASSGLQLAIESVLSGDKKLEAVANALWGRVLNETDLETVRQQVEEYMENNGIGDTTRNVAVDRKKKTLTIRWTDKENRSHRISIGKNARFGKKSLVSRIRQRITGISFMLQAAKDAEEAAANTLTLPLKTISPGYFISRILTAADHLLNNQGFLLNDDLIREIEMNEDLQKCISNNLGIEMRELAEMFPWIQKTTAAQALAERDIQLSEEQHRLLMKALLAVPQIHDLVVSTYAGRILKDSSRTAVKEFPDTLNEVKFREAHKTAIDNYFPNLVEIRENGITALAAINTSNSVVRVFRNIAYHTYWTATYWGTPAALTINLAELLTHQEPEERNRIYAGLSLKAIVDMITAQLIGGTGLAGEFLTKLVGNGFKFETSEALMLVERLGQKAQIGQFLANLAGNGVTFESSDVLTMAEKLIESGEAGWAGEFLAKSAGNGVTFESADALKLAEKLIESGKAVWAGEFLVTLAGNGVSFESADALRLAEQLIENNKADKAGEFLAKLAGNGVTFESSAVLTLAEQVMKSNNGGKAGEFLAKLAADGFAFESADVLKLAKQLIENREAKRAGVFLANLAGNGVTFESSDVLTMAEKLIESGEAGWAGEFLAKSAGNGVTFEAIDALKLAKQLMKSGEAGWAGEFIAKLANNGVAFEASDILTLVEKLVENGKTRRAGGFLAKLAAKGFTPKPSDALKLAEKLIRNGEAGWAGEFLAKLAGNGVTFESSDVRMLTELLINQDDTTSATGFLEQLISNGFKLESSDVRMLTELLIKKMDSNAIGEFLLIVASYGFVFETSDARKLADLLIKEKKASWLREYLANISDNEVTFRLSNARGLAEQLINQGRVDDTANILIKLARNGGMFEASDASKLVERMIKSSKASSAGIFLASLVDNGATFESSDVLKLAWQLIESHETGWAGEFLVKSTGNGVTLEASDALKLAEQLIKNYEAERAGEFLANLANNGVAFESQDALKLAEQLIKNTASRWAEKFLANLSNKGIALEALDILMLSEQLKRKSNAHLAGFFLGARYKQLIPEKYHDKQRLSERIYETFDKRGLKNSLVNEYVADKAINEGEETIDNIRNKISEIETIFIEKNLLLEENRRFDMARFESEYRYLLFNLEMILPGSLDNLISLVKSAANPNLLPRFLDEKRNILASGPASKAIDDIYRAYRNKKGSGRINVERMFKLLNIGEAYISIGKRGALQELLNNYDTDVSSIEENHKKSAKGFVEMVAQVFSIEVDKMDLNIYSRLPIKYLSRLNVGMNFIKTVHEEKLKLFEGILKSMLEGSFGNFISDTNKESNPDGYYIARHNERVKEAMRKAGVDPDKWLGYNDEKVFSADEEKVDLEMEYRDRMEETGRLLLELNRILGVHDGNKQKGLVSAVKKVIGREITAGEDAKELGAALRKAITREINGRADNNADIKSISTIKAAVNYIMNKSEVDDIREAGGHIIETTGRLEGIINNPDQIKELAAKKDVFRVRMWKRDPAHDLFLGDFTDCCMASSANQHFDDLLDHLVDIGIQVAEVVDEDSGETVALAWLFLAKDGNEKTHLVIDNIEVTSRLANIEHVKETIKNELIDYTKRMATELEIDSVLGGDFGYSKVSMAEYPKGTFILEKIGGYWNNKRYYLEALGKSFNYVIAEGLTSRTINSTNQLILPGNIPLVRQWKLEGESDWKVAERIARLESIGSLNPAKYVTFFLKHAAYYKGGNVSRAFGVAAMWAVTTGNFITGLFSEQSLELAGRAAMEAQIAFHAKRDLPVIRAMKVGLDRAMSSEELENIQMEAGIQQRIYTDTDNLDPEETNRLTRLGKGSRFAYQGKNIEVFAGSKDGALVFYMDFKGAGIKATDEARLVGMANVLRHVGGTDNMQGSKITVGIIRRMFKKQGVSDYGNISFHASIIIDPLNDEKKTKAIFSDLGINKPVFISIEDFNKIPDTDRNAVFQRMKNERKALSYTFGKNIGLKVDNAVIKSLEVHNLAVNSDIYVDMDKLSETAKSRVKEMAVQLKKAGILINFIENGSVWIDDEKKGIMEFDLKTDRQTNPEFAGKILDIKIPEGMTEEEIKDAFRRLNLSQKMMFRSNEIRDNIAAFRDIVDRKSFASFFDIIISLGHKEITTEVEAKEFGKNWELPLADDMQKQAILLRDKDFNGLKTLIGENQTRALVDEINKLPPHLQDAFVEGVLIKTLIKVKIMETDKQFGLEYAANKYKINGVDEEKLGKVLLTKFRETGSISGELDILNFVIADWRLSKPIRKEGLGIINTRNYALILGAA